MRCLPPPKQKKNGFLPFFFCLVTITRLFAELETEVSILVLFE